MKMASSDSICFARGEGATHERTWEAIESSTVFDLRLSEKGRTLEEAGVARDDSRDVWPVLAVEPEYAAVADTSAICCWGVVIGREGEEGTVRGVDMHRVAGTGRWGRRSSGGR